MTRTDRDWCDAVMREDYAAEPAAGCGWRPEPSGEWVRRFVPVEIRVDGYRAVWTPGTHVLTVYRLEAFHPRNLDPVRRADFGEDWR
jgi:hypothetical protein